MKRFLLALTLISSLTAPLSLSAATLLTDQSANTNLVYGGGAFTYEAWLYQGSAVNVGVFAIDDGGAVSNNKQFHAAIFSDGNVQFVTYNSGCAGANAEAFVGGNLIALNTWYYARFTYNGSNVSAMKFWNINGTEILSGSAAPASLCASGAKNLGIGRDSGTSIKFTGRMRGVYFADGVSDTNDVNSRTRSRWSNPMLHGPLVVGATQHFFPMNFGNDQRDLKFTGTTVTYSAVPNTASNPPILIGGSY